MNLITQEIGSFRKPDYLSSRFKTLNSKEFLEKAERATLETIDLFKKAGLDNIGIGGEMFRWEMYEHPVRKINGIEIYGPVRSFDNRFYNKGSVISELKKKESFHSDEIKFLKNNVKDKDIKVPITGPYTLMDWSFNEHYRSRMDLALAFSNIINEEIRELKNIWGEGKLQIQIDEPAATTHPDEMDIVLESVNGSISNIDGIETHLHVCYSTDYDLIFKIIPDLKIDVYNLEFANRDKINKGKERPGYGDIKRFSEVNETMSRKRSLGVGVTDVHIDFVEPVDLIKDRIEYSLKYLDPSLMRLNPDCGLRTRSREVGFQKLKNMVDAKNEVLKNL